MARTLIGTTRTVIPSARTVIPTTRTPASTGGAPVHMNAGTLWDDFESGWSLLSGGGSVSHTNEHVKTGTNSLKCTTASGTNQFVHKTISQSLAAYWTFGLWVYVESPIGDKTQTQQVSIYIAFSSDTFGSKSLIAANTYFSLSHGWNWVSWGRDQFTAAGGQLWSDTMNDIRIKIFAWSGQVITMHLDSLYFNRSSLPIITLDFDDGWDSTYTEAFSYMNARGMQGNIYLVSSFVGAANRLTTAQIDEMYSAGWDVCNHTDTHQDMTAYSEAQATTEWNTCDAYIIAHGWTRRNCHRHTGTPFGGYGSGVLASLSTNAYTSGRNSDGAMMPPFPDNIYHDKDYVFNGLTQNSVATLTAYVDRVVAAGMGARLVFHRLVAGAPSGTGELQNSVFEGFINYLYRGNNVRFKVATRTQVEEIINGRRFPV